jgi:hypothetical protein
MIRDEPDHPEVRPLDLPFRESEELDVVILQPFRLTRLLQVRVAALVVVDLVDDPRDLVVQAVTGVWRVSNDRQKPSLPLDRIYGLRLVR